MKGNDHGQAIGGHAGFGVFLLCSWLGAGGERALAERMPYIFGDVSLGFVNAFADRICLASFVLGVQHS